MNLLPCAISSGNYHQQTAFISTGEKITGIHVFSLMEVKEGTMEKKSRWGGGREFKKLFLPTLFLESAAIVAEICVKTFKITME